MRGQMGRMGSSAIKREPMKATALKPMTVPLFLRLQVCVYMFDNEDHALRLDCYRFALPSIPGRPHLLLITYIRRKWGTQVLCVSRFFHLFFHTLVNITFFDSVTLFVITFSSCYSETYFDEISLSIYL